MPPVEPKPARAGNPGASRSVRPRLRRERHHGRRGAGASAASVERARCARARSAGSAARPGVEPRCGPRASTRRRSSGCRGRSGCTGRPARGSARTGTGGRVGPCAPRHNRSAGRTRPKRATLAWHRLHRHGAGRGTVVELARKRDRCRAHLLRHRPRCTAACRARRQASPTARVPASMPMPATATPAPAWPPCRAARQVHTLVKAVPGPQALLGRTCRASKPPPHRRIEAVPDQRSQSRRDDAADGGLADAQGGRRRKRPAVNARQRGPPRPANAASGSPHRRRCVRTRCRSAGDRR